MTQKQSIKFSGTDFLKIQKIIQKIKSDPTRLFLDQARIKIIDKDFALVSFTNGLFIVNKKIKFLSNSLEENTFICFDSIKNMRITQNSIIEITKEYIKNQDQQCNINKKGHYPDIDKLESESKGQKISLNFKILEIFKPLLVDNVLNLSFKEMENHIEVSTKNEEILGIICALKHIK